MYADTPMSVLVIIASTSSYDLIRPFLTRSNLEITRAHSGPEGLAICRSGTVDLVIAQYPLTGLTPADFFGGLYKADPERTIPLLLLTRLNRMDEIQGYLAGRPARACYLDTVADENFHQALYELVGVSARCSERLLVTAEVEFAGSSVERIFQTANISKSGLLLKTKSVLPIGEVVPFSLQLPDEDSNIRAVGEIVRHADADAEGLRGVGLRIIDFEGTGEGRFLEYIDSLPRAG